MGVAATSMGIFDAEGMLQPYAPKGLNRIAAQYRDKKNPPEEKSWTGAYKAFIKRIRETGVVVDCGVRTGKAGETQMRCRSSRSGQSWATDVTRRTNTVTW